MSIESQLKVFAKTDKFRKLVAEKIKNNPNFGSGSYHKTAVKFGDEMKEFLRNEIVNIKSSTTNESFLDHIIVNEEFLNGTGWTINVSFDEDKVTRNSLFWQNPKYEMGAYLPTLFNEGYDADNYVYGYDDNGTYYSYSKKHREALYFIQRAVDLFNTKYKGKAVAQYNSKYTGGTL